MKDKSDQHNDNDDERKYPPSFDLSLDDRRRAILNSYELMERLADEYDPAEARIARCSSERLAVVLEFDLPEGGDET